MTSLTSLLLFVNFIFLITICRAQDRSPHGLAYESPMAFSPEAYDFFHPNKEPESSKGSCTLSECSTFPVAAATVQSTPGHESTSAPEEGRKRLGAGAAASIPIGFFFALIVGLGVYYVVLTRQSNAERAKAAQLEPDV